MAKSASYADIQVDDAEVDVVTFDVDGIGPKELRRWTWRERQSSSGARYRRTYRRPGGRGISFEEKFQAVS